MSDTNETDDPDIDFDQVEEDVDLAALQASSRAGEDALREPEGAAPAPPQLEGSEEPGTALDSGTDSLADLINGDRPLFVVHKSYQRNQRIPELLGAARRRAGRSAGIGVAIRLPRMSTTAAATYLGNCSSAAVKIADPEIYSIPGTGGPEKQPGKAPTYHPWMTAVPSSVDSSWIRQVLDTQIAAGANVLLSASGWVGDQSGRQQLADAMDWVRGTRAELGDQPMFVNLTLSTGWLTNPTLRAVLKHEIVESNERLWWLRFYWPVVEPRYGQLVDHAILAGYRDIAVTAALEEKFVLFPNTGLTGWIATAWGAQGFSTGTSWPEQMFGVQPIRRSAPGKPKAPPVERYFDRTILHTIPYSDHLLIRSTNGHTTCSCRFCRQLQASPSYDQTTADLHYLLQCADLVASLNSRRPGHCALRQVQDARRFTARVTPPLVGPARPQHLPIWESLLP